VSKITVNIVKIFSFSFYEYRIFTQSWFLYLKWDLLISFFNYKYWQSHLGYSSLLNGHSNKQTITPVFLHKIIQLNEKAGRNHFRKMNCLRRCLCQKEQLSNIGFICSLHLGVKFVEGKLAAHSWLSLNGEVINDSPDVISTYEELVNLTEAKALSLFK